MSEKEIRQAIEISYSSGTVMETIHRLEPKMNIDDIILTVNTLKNLAHEAYTKQDTEKGEKLIQLWRKYNSENFEKLSGLELSKYINKTISK